MFRARASVRVRVRNLKCNNINRTTYWVLLPEAEVQD